MPSYSFLEFSSSPRIAAGAERINCHHRAHHRDGFKHKSASSDQGERDKRLLLILSDIDVKCICKFIASSRLALDLSAHGGPVLPMADCAIAEAM